MALKAKLENPQRNTQPEKGTAAKVTHKQKREREKEKRTPPKQKPLRFPEASKPVGP